MKKVFVILLVLTLAVCCVFADASVNEGSHRLTISSLVDQIFPQFAFYGTLNSDYSTDVVKAKTDNESGEAEIDSGLDVSENDITVYFIIKQNSALKTDGTEAAYARYNQVLTFSISIGALTEQDPYGGRAAATVAGQIVSNSAVAGSATTYTGYKEGESKTLNNAISNSYDSLVFTSIYNGRVNNSQEIGRFAAVWYKDTTIPSGSYEADVTVTIATV